MASDLRRVPREKILLAETRETERQLHDQISLFQDSIADSANELMEQALSSLEDTSERLGEICNELQTAARERIKLSKAKINELRTEVRALMDEIESSGKLALA